MKIERETDKSCALERTSVPALDAILGWAFPLLDHGFIRVIDYMGDDASVVQMARVSYGEGTKSVSDDSGLIRYLMRHHHTSPFEGCEIKLHVKLPVFVARQWIRHRVANVNEYSARYSILADEFYLPEADVLMEQSVANKQGRANLLDPHKAEVVRQILFNDAARAYDHYEDMIYLNPDDPNDPDNMNLARELARINLPVSIYTQWYWKIDLHNLIHFLRLRADSHAQYEIRVYAEKIKEILDLWVPNSAAAAEEYIFGAISFSKTEMRVLRQIALSSIGTGEIERRLRDAGLSAGEVRESLIKIRG